MTTVRSVVVGGSNGLGRVIAQRCAERDEDVLITSRDKARAEAIAGEIGGKTRGLGVDLSRPETIAEAFSPRSPRSTTS
jgi:short-subunit dehydrogenase